MVTTPQELTLRSPATFRSRHRCRTDYLFPKPSFASGFASSLDLFGVFDAINFSHDEDESNRRALRCDALMVRQDFERSYKTVYERRRREQLRLFDDDEFGAVSNVTK